MSAYDVTGLPMLIFAAKTDLGSFQMEFRCLFPQEILDQIADIDLVVNFKSTEEHLEKKKKNLGTGKFSPCQKYMGKSTATGYSQNGQQVSTTTDPDVLWKEKFSNYAEQVCIDTNKLLFKLCILKSIWGPL